MLATPLLAVLIVVIQMVYVEDILGDKQEINKVVSKKDVEREAEELEELEERDAKERAGLEI